MKDGRLALLNDDSLTGENVDNVFGLRAEEVQGHALTGKHVICVLALERARAKTKRSNTIRVTKSDEAKASEHGGASPAALAFCIGSLQGGEAVVAVDTCFSRFIQFVGEDVEHELAVAVGVDVAVGFLVQEALELRSIDEITIVREGDAGGVDEERLSLLKV